MAPPLPLFAMSSSGTAAPALNESGGAIARSIAPDVPPPLRPGPALTEVMSPVSWQVTTPIREMPRIDWPMGQTRESGRWSRVESTMLVSTDAGKRPLLPSGSSIPGRGRRDTPTPPTFREFFALSASLACDTPSAAEADCVMPAASDAATVAVSGGPEHP